MSTEINAAGEDRFLRRFRSAVVGVGGAPLITIALTPLLTRLYSVEAWGVFGAFMGTLNILNKISCLRYDRAILIPEDDREAAAVCNLAISIGVALSAASTALIALGWALGIPWVRENLLVALLLPATILVVSAYQITHQWMNRVDRLGLLSVSRIVAAVATFVLQVVLFYVADLQYAGLVLGHLGGLLLSQGLLVVAMTVQDGAALRAALSLDLLREVARRYREFPLVNMWFGAFNALANRLPVFLFLGLYGATIAGYFSLCNRVLSAPSLLVGQSVGLALSKTFVEERHANGSGGHAVKRSVSLLFAFALAPFAVLVAFGVPIFEIVFGPEWSEAGRYAQILAPMVLLQLVIFPLTNVPILMQRHRAILLWAVTKLLAVGLAIYAGYALWTARGAVFLYAIARAASLLALLIGVVRATNAWPRFARKSL